MTNKEKLHELDKCWQEISSRRWWRTFNGVCVIGNLVFVVVNLLNSSVAAGITHIALAIGVGAMCVYEWHKLANAKAHRKSLLEARDD